MFQFTDEKIKDASCGYYHTGLVTQSGKVFTFGENDNGKLGLGEDADDTYHVPQVFGDVSTELLYISRLVFYSFA